MLFSQRSGLKPARKPLQLDEVDDELRNAIWSVFFELVLKNFEPSITLYSSRDQLSGSNLEVLFFSYWFTLFQLPTDTIPISVDNAIKFVRTRFFAGTHSDVYDFIEVTLAGVREVASLQNAWNGHLEKHNAAYRIVDGIVTKITSYAELSSIEAALATPLSGLRTHLRTSLTERS